MVGIEGELEQQLVRYEKSSEILFMISGKMMYLRASVGPYFSGMVDEND